MWLYEISQLKNSFIFIPKNCLDCSSVARICCTLVKWSKSQMSWCTVSFKFTWILSACLSAVRPSSTKCTAQEISNSWSNNDRFTNLVHSFHCTSHHSFFFQRIMIIMNHSSGDDERVGVAHKIISIALVFPDDGTCSIS